MEVQNDNVAVDRPSCRLVGRHAIRRVVNAWSRQIVEITGYVSFFELQSLGYGLLNAQVIHRHRHIGVLCQCHVVAAYGHIPPVAINIRNASIRTALTSNDSV